MPLHGHCQSCHLQAAARHCSCIRPLALTVVRCSAELLPFQLSNLIAAVLRLDFDLSCSTLSTALRLRLGGIKQHQAGMDQISGTLSKIWQWLLPHPSRKPSRRGPSLSRSVPA